MSRSSPAHEMETAFTRRRWLRGCGVGLLGLSLPHYLALRASATERRGRRRIRPSAGLHRFVLLGRRQPARNLGPQTAVRRPRFAANSSPSPPRSPASTSPSTCRHWLGGMNRPGSRPLGASYLHGARQIDVLKKHPATLRRSRRVRSTCRRRINDWPTLEAQVAKHRRCPARLAGLRANPLSVGQRRPTLQAGDRRPFRWQRLCPRSCFTPIAASPLPGCPQRIQSMLLPSPGRRRGLRPLIRDST